MRSLIYVNLYEILCSYGGALFYSIFFSFKLMNGKLLLKWIVICTGSPCRCKNPKLRRDKRHPSLLVSQTLISSKIPLASESILMKCKTLRIFETSLTACSPTIHWLVIFFTVAYSLIVSTCCFNCSVTSIEALFSGNGAVNE